MPCGRCNHRSRFHPDGAWPPCTMPKCECQGWSPASNKAQDFLCAACGKERGFDWLSGRVVCWPCWRDAERAGQAVIVAKARPLVRRAAP